MNFRKTFGLEKTVDAQVIYKAPENDDDELEKLKQQRDALLAKKQIPSPKIEKVKKNNYLDSPLISANSKEILENLTAHTPKAFMAAANAYGKALAENILIQSKAQNLKKINFDEEFIGKMEMRGSSYALIYKGDTPVRIAPCIWQLDQGTRRMWLIFTFNNFYGHKDPPSWKVWKRFWTVMVITPFDNSSDMVDRFGKGYLIKVDENTQFQVALADKDTKPMEQTRALNKAFISSALTLWQDLSAFTKPQMNWKLIMYLVGGAILIVVGYWWISNHPGILNGLFPTGGK